MIAKTGAMIFFSLTGTTKKVLHAFFSGLEINSPSIIGLTHVISRSRDIDTIKENIAVIGMPVYEETIPEVVVDTLMEKDNRNAQNIDKS